MSCVEVPPLVIDFIRNGLRDSEIVMLSSAMVPFPSSKRDHGWPEYIVAARLDNHGEIVDGTWGYGESGTLAMNDIARTLSDLGEGIPVGSRGDQWQQFPHAVSYDEATEALACLDR